MQIVVAAVAALAPLSLLAWPDDRSEYDRAEPTDADDDREALAELLNATEERESV